MGTFLPPKGHLIMSGDIFPCHDWGWVGATGITWVEVKNTAEHPVTHRVAPTGPTLHNAEVKRQSSNPKEASSLPRHLLRRVTASCNWHVPTKASGSMTHVPTQWSSNLISIISTPQMQELKSNNLPKVLGKWVAEARHRRQSIQVLPTVPQVICLSLLFSPSLKLSQGRGDRRETHADLSTGPTQALHTGAHLSCASGSQTFGIRTPFHTCKLLRILNSFCKCGYSYWYSPH